MSRDARWLGAAALAAALALDPPARADTRHFDDPYALPDAPRPPTLPELTHAETEATFEATMGAVLPSSGTPAHAYVERLAMEIPLGRRRWFVGANYDVAEGVGAGVSRGVSGNLEVQGRTLWATATGLGFGGGLALVLPLARFDEGSPAAAVAASATALRPWDVSFFVPSAFGARPFVDVRAVDGAFVAQFRQGLDVMVSTSAPTGPLRVYATAGLYLGWRASAFVAAGIEAFEGYAIEVPGIRDGSRAEVIVSPNVRLKLGIIEPAISAFTNIGTPLQGTSEHVWGFRFAATLALPRREAAR